jgi:hypothetical protein
MKNDTTMRIVIATQYHENYGAHDWDGTGTCPQYWKAKGGSEYVINITLAKVLELGGKGLATLVAQACEKFINRRDNYAEEYMIDWELMAVGERTEREGWGIEASVLPLAVF